MVDKVSDAAKRVKIEGNGSQPALAGVSAGASPKGGAPKSINSSIGSKWRYRIDVNDEQIVVKAKNMTPEQLKNTSLNVKLTH